MSLSKFESEVKHVAIAADAAYARVSDLRNLESFKERLADPSVREALASQIPEDKMASMQEAVKNIKIDADSISIASPVGEVRLNVVERDPKCVKLASENSPLPLFVWVQLLPEGDAATKMRVTVGAEVNIFMKGMISKPLQQAADMLAQMLAYTLSV